MCRFATSHFAASLHHYSSQAPCWRRVWFIVSRAVVVRYVLVALMQLFEQLCPRQVRDDTARLPRLIHSHTAASLSHSQHASPITLITRQALRSNVYHGGLHRIITHVQ